MRPEVLQTNLTPCHCAVPVVSGLDKPDLLRPAPVQRSRAGGEVARGAGTVEVGAVRDADHLAVLTEPQRSPQAGEGLDNGAVNAAVEDAVRLVHLRQNRPARRHLVAVGGVKDQAKALGEWPHVDVRVHSLDAPGFFGEQAAP